MTVQPSPSAPSLLITNFVYDWSFRLQLSLLWTDVAKPWILRRMDSAKMFEITNFSGLLAVDLLQDDDRDLVLLDQPFHYTDLPGGKALIIQLQHVGLGIFPSRIVPFNSRLIYICHTAGPIVHTCNPNGTACSLSLCCHQSYQYRFSGPRGLTTCVRVEM